MSKTSQAHQEGRTLYPKSRKGADYTSSVLKRSSNAKLGKRVERGPWKGAVIYTLTLEERATCPNDCAMWKKCYGDNMPFAHRMVMPPKELMERIKSELKEICHTHEKVAIRLHVLGDFFSREYVLFWNMMMFSYSNLYVWGYTARNWKDPIGETIQNMNQSYPNRWLVRFSNTEEKDNCPEEGIYTCAVDTKSNYITCPEQIGKTESCGTCGLCWNHNVKRGIRFLPH
jgi:hypothetical protein